MLPQIPTRLARRPLSGGLVVPWISVQSGDGRHLLGEVHANRSTVCVVRQLCQIDGERLHQPCVVLVASSALLAGWTREPAMHPECARYAAKACPMVSGQMTHFRSEAPDLSRLRCDRPGCDCPGWQPSAGSAPPAGQPAEAYSLLWLSQYDTAKDRQGVVIGVAWQPS